MTGTAIRLLAVEDVELDVHLTVDQLTRDGFDVAWTRVDTEASLRKALASARPDVIVSDFRMPAFDGLSALKIAREVAPEVPFIFVSGAIGEERAIETLHHGAVDYVLKDNLQRVASSVRRALENASRKAELAAAHEALKAAHEKLNRTFLTLIRVFANLIELREGAVAGHSRHVAESARQLASRMQLGDRMTQDVTLAGLLHGIGEFGLPDNLLHKPQDALTAAEREKVSKQPVCAQAALMGVDQLAEAAKLIRSYRERFDGTGYPDRLAGPAIPLGARVLSVVHDFEAAQEGTLTGSWLSKLQARDYLLRERGSRYDPQVVDAFMDLLGERGVTNVAERTCRIAELKEGMVLARDVVTPDGLLLLPKESALSNPLIEQLGVYAARDGRSLRIHVREAPGVQTLQPSG